MGTTEHANFLNVQVPDEMRERMEALSARAKAMAADIDAIREEYIELAEWEDALENAFEIQSDDLVRASGADPADFRLGDWDDGWRSFLYCVSGMSAVSRDLRYVADNIHPEAFEAVVKERKEQANASALLDGTQPGEGLITP
jgi:hypothetical protein